MAVDTNKNMLDNVTYIHDTNKNTLRFAIYL